jgi:hypothetical protein
MHVVYLTLRHNLLFIAASGGRLMGVGASLRRIRQKIRQADDS